MSIKIREEMYKTTIKNLDNLSLDELKKLAREKSVLIEDIEYELAFKRAISLTKVIKLYNDFQKNKVEYFQNKVWNKIPNEKEFDRNTFIIIIKTLDDYKDYLLKNEQCVFINLLKKINESILWLKQWL